MAPDTPTPATQGPPTTPDEAVDIVRARYAQPKLPDGTPAELQVHEFDIGYLVYPTFPPRPEASGPRQPAPPGGAKIVVSKETGETVTVPNYPTEQAIALYRKNRARNT
ncbi:hypothetical protein E0500_018975 [Streptomyces sp. KM273126]|uniref:hypothetical protein n=1 Tax=Streptomyces sp. KM273126 TaxID=2545247 RepID=UPI0015EC06B6|nr:hypothetical protein [Streptomyces sp. KM273126]MBA2809425.1 hypothetical protein [Streptomyces sp. KM273126]